MHFLGAVIGGNNTSEAKAIIDPYSEYEEVEEYVLYTRDEFLKDNRENDRRLIEREGENQHDRMSEAFEEAERRLALNDEEALEVYAQYCGYSLNEDGDVVSTFNDDSFYDWYEFGGRWEELTEGVQGKTCKELSTLYENGDSTVVTLLDDLCVFATRTGMREACSIPCPI